VTETSSTPVRSGAWCLLGEPLTSARVAALGFDWVCLDAQHGAFGDASLLETLRTLPAGTASVVRVASLDAAAIGRALDAGAGTVIVPLIDTAAQAAAAVDAAFYPPRGRRSWGPITPLWNVAAPGAADAETGLWIMVESRQALDELDAILAVPGITGVFVGPYDLALTLGITLDELLAAPDEAAPLRRIVAACAAAGIAAGAFAGEPVKAARLAELGFADVVVATDAGLLEAGARAVLGAASDTVSGY
jgi:4-hydroxy-2-oxoheptanedioate aldolase